MEEDTVAAEPVATQDMAEELLLIRMASAEVTERATHTEPGAIRTRILTAWVAPTLRRTVKDRMVLAREDMEEATATMCLHPAATAVAMARLVVLPTEVLPTARQPRSTAALLRLPTRTWREEGTEVQLPTHMELQVKVTGLRRLAVALTVQVLLTRT